MNKFNNKIKNFIKFLTRNPKIKARIENLQINNETKSFYFRLIPSDFDIRHPTSVIKYCNLYGLNIDYDYIRDENRTNGYRDFIECYIYTNDYFGKNNSLEIINEMIK